MNPSWPCSKVGAISSSCALSGRPPACHIQSCSRVYHILSIHTILPLGPRSKTDAFSNSQRWLNVKNLTRFPKGTSCSAQLRFHLPWPSHVLLGPVCMLPPPREASSASPMRSRLQCRFPTECKMVRLWKTVWQFLKRLNAPHSPAIPLLGSCLRNGNTRPRED